MTPQLKLPCLPEFVEAFDPIQNKHFRVKQIGYIVQVVPFKPVCMAHQVQIADGLWMVAFPDMEAAS